MILYRFATWNVRGFRDKAKHYGTLAFAQAQGIDVLFVQETNFRTPLDVATFRRDFHVDAFFSLTSSRSCGVGVIFVTGRIRQKALVPSRPTGDVQDHGDPHDRTYLPDYLLSSVVAIRRATQQLPSLADRSEHPSGRSQRATDRRPLETLRRMRIIRGAETLTVCTRDYLDALEVNYIRLLRLKPRRPPKAHGQSDKPTSIDLSEVCRNGGVRIMEAQRPDGSVSTDRKEIASIFRNYLRSQFQGSDLGSAASTAQQMHQLCQHLQRLGEEDITTLCGGATTDELHGAMRGMLANSAPGVDGLTAGFYATFFEILGDALLSLVNAILSQCKKPHSFSAGRIVLLLKDGAPITLLSVGYRIVAFVALVEQLWSGLHCSVIVHGDSTPSFRYTRGVRQGCPLGPTFYILTIEPLLTQLSSNKCIRGFRITGDHELNVLAYADDVCLFVGDESSFRVFWRTFDRYADVSGAEINVERCKGLLFGAFPAEAIGSIQTVTTVKVLGIYFYCGGVAETTLQKALERARLATARIRHLDLILRQKALAAKTCICAFGNCQTPARERGGPSPPPRRDRWQGARPEAWSLYQANDFLGKGLLRHWSSTKAKFLDADRHLGPLAETPSTFYKAATNTKKVLDTEAADCDVDKVLPVRIVEETAGNGTGLSATEPSRDSWSEPQSQSEEQQALKIAEPLEEDDVNFPPLPPGNSCSANPDDKAIVSCGRYIIPSDHAYVLPATDPGSSHLAPANSS
ncbi:hypothetical protein HPB52_022899 [Rhipicephalus sanguineus]|uniref:Reverse transcriptase domain-containing protein n=1 Tax=Rhipicephalus sanguineus TaxID=34632 RepID=A0A9D4Q3N6_RHISA|nr:hypothetical protein HPB52_022899 [Rhipicephalus sanguineus]